MVGSIEGQIEVSMRLGSGSARVSTESLEKDNYRRTQLKTNCYGLAWMLTQRRVSGYKSKS